MYKKIRARKRGWTVIATSKCSSGWEMIKQTGSE